MLISKIGAATGGAQDAGDVTIDLTTITGLAENDLVILAAALVGNDGFDRDMLLVSTGWTEIADLWANDAEETNLGVWYKKMGATPDTSVTYDGPSTSTQAGVAAVAVAYRGVDVDTPLDVATTTDTGINSGQPNPPSIDHLNPAGIWTVIVVATGHGGGAPTYTWPDGYQVDPAQRGEDDSLGITVGIAQNPAPADPENPGTVTHSTNSVNMSWAAATLALRPAPPAPPAAPAASTNRMGGVGAIRKPSRIRGG